MIQRITFILLSTTLVLLITGQGALAATAQTIHRDAADGRIDGDYSLADLRAADRNAPVELVEYGGWPDMYQDALRRKSTPGEDAPSPYVAIDSNKNGTIDPAEQAAADAKNKAAGIDPEGSSAQHTARSCDDDADEGDCVARGDKHAGGSSGDGSSSDGNNSKGSMLIWPVVMLPLAILVFGTWRLRRREKKDDEPE